MPSNVSLTDPGAFVVGSNYLASHAGTHMWSDWRADVVDRDFRLMSEAGLQVLRVFAHWPDFQPLTLLRGGGGAPVEFRHGEEPLPDDPCGQAGMSAEMMAHFAEFLDLAAKYDLKLLVGLLTGWMSGRMLTPAPFEGPNVLTDPVAIQWELRFVRHFVSTFRDRPEIIAWDLGNECNCMGPANREQAYTWTATISNVIRAADPTRPVVSGMHSLSPVGDWRMRDQGELTDLLCVHPYPAFTPHCDQDPVNTIRPILHSTAEARYYADLGGKPCICQEIGTLGPMFASERVAADFIRGCLFSLWANDCHGVLPWGAHDQTHLAHAPYDWHAVERELGLLRLDGSAKPWLQELTAFRRMLDGLPFDRLPLRRREAVCILSEQQDQWGVAFSSFILAKQAGFDIEFQYCDEPIRAAPLYLLPCLTGHAMVPRRRMIELLAKVEAGATLYVSLDTGLPSEFEALVGLGPQTRERRREFGAIRLDGIAGTPEIPCGGTFKTRYQPTRAGVLATESDGNPAFTVADYGKGHVYFLSVPLEMLLTQTPGAFHAENAAECWRVYQHIAAPMTLDRAVLKSHPMVAVTEHPVDETRRIVIAVNQSPEPVAGALALAEGWRLTNAWHGDMSLIPGNNGVVFELTR